MSRGFINLPSIKKNATLPRRRPSPAAQKESSQTRVGPARKLANRLLDWLIILIFLFGLIYCLIIKPEPTVVINTTVYHPLSIYKQAVNNKFQSLTNQNKITIDTKSIINQLKKQFPEIAGAIVDIPVFSQTATVKLNIPPPSFFLDSQGTKYVLSSSGTAIAKSPSLKQIHNLPVLEDQTGYTVTIGQPVIAASQVEFINTVLGQAKAAKVPVSGLTLPAKAMELDLRAQDQSYYVKFYIGGDAMLEVGQYLAARHQFATSHTQPSEYLDVRVPGKIYYK